MAYILHIFLLACSLNLYVFVSGELAKKINGVVSQVCFQKVDSAVEECIGESHAKWNSTQLIINQDKSLCCHDWDIIDCAEKFVKVGF